MAANDQTRIRTGSTGRGFACMDPERQGQTVSFVRTAPVNTFSRPARPAGMDWIRTAPERDPGYFEGSSSRRSR